MSRFALVLLFLSLVLLSGTASPDGSQPPTPHRQWLAEQLADPAHFHPGPDLSARRLPAASHQPQLPEAPLASLAEHHRGVYQGLVTIYADGYVTNHWDLYFADPTGPTDARRLTNGNRKVNHVYPRLSPAAARIAYATDGGGETFQIYTMNTDGSGQFRVTPGDADHTHPDWSPDGIRLVYQSYDDGQAEIYVINLDGTGRTRLTNHPAYDGMPVWSPDGSRIAFVSTRTGAAQLYFVNPDGSGLKQLPTPVEALYPVWSREGDRLAFAGDQSADGWLELWTVNTDGSSAQLQWNPGPARDAIPRSYFTHGTIGWVALTAVDWVSQGGQWYWTAANLLEWTATAAGGPPSMLVFHYLPAWHPDVATVDMIPPVMPDSLAVAPLYFGRIQAYPAPATDSGGSGLMGYDQQVQQYPGGAWSYLTQWTSGYSIDYEALGGIYYRFRQRAWDYAGNASDWVYSSPTRIYNVRLDTLVTDHRGQPLDGVVLLSDPPSFLLSSAAPGRRLDYFAHSDPYQYNIIKAEWRRPGYGPTPLTWIDGSRPDHAIHVVLPPARNLVANGSFESGTLEPWQVQYPGSPEDGPFIGDWLAHLGRHSLTIPSANSGPTSVILPLTIPADMAAPTLSFFVLAPPFREDIQLFARVTSGAQTTTLFTQNGPTGDEWRHVWRDMTPWAGKSITLTLTVPALAGDLATLAVDDITLGDGGPDIWVSAGSRAAALPAETGVLTIGYGNAGQLQAPGSVLTATLPAGLTYVSAAPAPSSTAPLRWELGTLPAGQSSTVRITVRLDGAMPAWSTLTALAGIASPSETLLANNSATIPLFAGAQVMLPQLVR
jgi:uncharacterized repeat protein (TIGR01451 family)